MPPTVPPVVRAWWIDRFITFYSDNIICSNPTRGRAAATHLGQID